MSTKTQTATKAETASKADTDTSKSDVVLTTDKINESIETASNKLEGGIDAASHRLQDLVESTANVLGGVGHVGAAMKDSAGAYYRGVTGLAGLLGQFGREIIAEAGDHARQTLNARCVREAGVLQVAYAQHRIDSAASHAQEFTLAARDAARGVVAPFSLLITSKSA